MSADARGQSVDFRIDPAGPGDARVVAVMVGELLEEIMVTSGVRAFTFDLERTVRRAKEFLSRGVYFVYVARLPDGREAGVVAVSESHALYAGGDFGTVVELYVRPPYRSHGVGKMLLDRAKALGAAKGWTRLEVTTPPLPEFERTLLFYEKEEFGITGGRKLKYSLQGS
ncbi:MAG: GNAT family N-acetyltransferase [Gammaproteobacteria bacterium]